VKVGYTHWGRHFFNYFHGWVSAIEHLALYNMLDTPVSEKPPYSPTVSVIRFRQSRSSVNNPGH
jgi:hypothetical protein